ncbi:MAG: BatA domain-containing protein, partial [Planctomycetes bacterium]|nr:BatA domain-containing protein [Planctomycetota bacterium]
MESMLDWILLIIKLMFGFSIFVWFFSKRSTNFTRSILFILAMFALLWAGWDILSGFFPETFKVILGIDKLDDESLKKAGLPRFISLPPLWVIFMVIIPAVFVFVGFIYAREKKSVDAKTKILLTILRISVLALIILALFEPNLILQENAKRYSQVLVLLDNSKSMNQRDLYINRWSEVKKEGEIETITQHEAIRSQYARENFGIMMLKKLILDNLQTIKPSENLDTILNNPDLPIKLDDEFQTEFNLQQLEIYMDSDYDFKNLLYENLKLEYINLLIDFLDTLPDDVMSLSVRSGIRESVNIGSTPQKQSSEFFKNIKDRVDETYYLHLLILDRMIIQNESFEVIEKDLTQILEAHFAKYVYLPKKLSEDSEILKDFYRKMPREFGMMDSFCVAVQFRRIQRLFKKILRLNEGEIALGACLELINQQKSLRKIIEKYQEKIASPQVSEEDISELRNYNEIYSKFISTFSEIYKNGYDNNKLTSALEQLFETSKGMRRIDIALELMHPNANFKGIINLKNNDFPGLDEFKMIANISTMSYPRNNRYNKLDIRTFSEGGVTTALPADDQQILGDSLDTVVADGNRTEIGTSADAALRSLLKRHIDIDHLSSMIIISDGLNNQGLPTTSLMKEIEVNTIAVGSRDTLHHLELFNLQAPTKVSKESDVSLVFNIQADEAYQRDKFGSPGGKNVEILLYRVVKHPDYEEEIPVRYDALVDVTPGLTK